MTDTILQEALFKQLPEPAPAMSEYQKEQQAIRDNHQRLKAARLARESTRTPSTK
jgi:hypothetical protein